MTDFRLPRDVAPRRYELWLAPDLDAARFTGNVAIELEVLAPVRRIVMNAAELEVRDASCSPGWRSDGSGGATADPDAPPPAGAGVQECAVSLEDEERVAFSPGDELAPGRYTVCCSFEGILNDQLHGFYRSVYTDDDGTEHVLATTQFEDTDARRAFPCFDEPDRKAVFSVTLDAPAGTMALSNGAEVASRELAGGGRRVRFSDTIPMSSYLVAFVVGRLEATEPVDAAGTPVRVVTVPGKTHLGRPALDAAVHALSYFRDYFGLPYPGDKVDLVAIPDFASGAMENLGCVTFREAILLADPEHAGRRELERLSEVVDHELAHMWFGDLVTMRWWNGIWLNEAFATFMALKCQDDYRPDWQVLLTFARARSAASTVDGLHATRAIEYPVHRPDEVAAMFDILTYEKGASVLWMIEQYLGEDRFRDGVRRYLAEHRHGNTETHDLWDALEAEAAAAGGAAGGAPVRAIMDSWIFQGGYPLVSVAPAGGGSHGGGSHGGEIELRQAPFSYLPAADAARVALVEGSAIGSSWLVPVLVGTAGGDAASSTRIVLRDGPVRVRTGGGVPLVNAGGSGFYRVAYAPQLHAELLARAGELAAIERCVLVSDTWAAVASAAAPLSSYFALLEALAGERDPDVCSLLFSGLNALDVVAGAEREAQLAAFVRARLRPLYDEIGHERRDGEDHRVSLLRSGVIQVLGNLGEDPTVIAEALAAVRADLTGRADVDPDLAAAVLEVALAHAERGDVDAVLARWREPRDPMDGIRHLYALGALRNEAWAQEVRRLCLGEVRSQNAPFLLGRMLANRHVSGRTWRFVTDHFDQLAERFPRNSITRMLDSLPGLAQLGPDGEPLHLDSVVTFCRDRVSGGRRRLVAQSVEQLAIAVRLARTVRAELDGILAGA